MPIRPGDVLNYDAIAQDASTVAVDIREGMLGSGPGAVQLNHDLALLINADLGPLGHSVVSPAVFGGSFVPAGTFAQQFAEVNALAQLATDASQHNFSAVQSDANVNIVGLNLVIDHGFHSV